MMFRSVSYNIKDCCMNENEPTIRVTMSIQHKALPLLGYASHLFTLMKDYFIWVINPDVSLHKNGQICDGLWNNVF